MVDEWWMDGVYSEAATFVILDAAAEAQYKIGRCYFTRKEYLEAGFEFRRVIEEYTESEWVKDSYYYLTRSYEEAALEPDYDQSPSRLARTHIAEFTRRYPDDPRNEERLEVSRELRESIAEQRYRAARFYVKRADFDS